MNQYQIYKSYTIAEKHPLFKSLAWCSQAVSKDDSRTALHHMRVTYSDKQYEAFATDGKRLHYVHYDAGMFDSDFTELLPGDYIVIYRSSKHLVLAVSGLSINFPDCRKLLRDAPMNHSVHLTQRTTASLCLASKKLMATDFLVEACGFGTVYKKADTAQVFYDAGDEANPAVIIQNEVGQALVMPMHYDVSGEIKDELEATRIMPEMKAYFEEDEEAE